MTFEVTWARFCEKNPSFKEEDAEILLIQTKVKKMIETAYKCGYEAGYQKGHLAGYNMGKDETESKKPDTSLFDSIFGKIDR